ncbi:EAL domain-containing protein [Actinoplanes sp. TBRC 11911]|uniref:EAL domain-containing protein n=1 Tax=Actinoplanes sp. TBRC 11911 TaxID=2729386 RepID=UPI0020070CD0|nr:EAL domain-containing protein [Actinoplanes sp. TBRC 11911]
MALLAATFVLEPGARTELRLLAGGSAALAVVVAMRRHRPSDRVSWRMLVAAVGLSALGGTAYAAPGSYPELLRPLGTVLLVAAYPALAAVLLVFIRRHTAKDRAAQFDALTLTSGVALLVWSFLLGPHLYDGSLRVILFPLGDLLCLGVLTRLLLSTGRTVTAGNLLGFGLVLMLIADLGYEISAFAGNVEIVADLGRFALYTAAGLAAIHPSMVELTRPGPPPSDELTPARLALLGVASMVAPAVLLTRMFIDGELPDLTVVALLSALTFLLVLGRMAGIMASHRLALARERALRQASAELVSAADTDAVNAAVRTAVTHLLPEDTPHGVVLAVTIAQDGPLGPEAAQQAIQDRRSGTTARLVATREVDWAVSVRLNQFPTTLRCPLVLTDRPTGDPLVGVLHVAAPSDALPGLRRSVEALAGQVALALERIGLSQEVIRRNSENYFRTLIQNTADVILIVDDEHGIRYASPSATATFGQDPTGMRLAQLIESAGNDDVRALRTGVLLETDSRDLRHDPTVAGTVITLRDVTERRRLERELTHQAFHDAMTGLPNRVLFHDRLRHALARAARDGSIVGVLFIDLDDFKIVNDTYGHAAGDQLLISVAHRLAGALRADDTAARLGGDEFAALVENVHDAGAVEETAQRILREFAPPIVTEDGTTLRAVASIGITTTPEAGSADELLRQADLALYVAKGAGKNQWRRYEKRLHDAMVERLELRSALDHAVHEGQFLLFYQPIVDLATDETAGFEALVRWHHPVRGVVAPDEFLEVAEESGLIVPMGRWVIEQALHTVAQWRRIMPREREIYVSVNVSPRQFRDPGFADQILQLLSYAGVPPQALMLELAENVLADDNSPVWPDLSVLRAQGVRVAIDDLGTGYSSLGYLGHRPIDVVKIDKAFIDDMVDDPRQTESIAGILQLAKSLDLVVIAEGIETERHRELLARMDCPLGQGYLFSSPVDGTEALGTMSGTHPLVA